MLVNYSFVQEQKHGKHENLSSCKNLNDDFICILLCDLMQLIDRFRILIKKGYRNCIDSYSSLGWRTLCQEPYVKSFRILGASFSIDNDSEKYKKLCLIAQAKVDRHILRFDILLLLLL